MISSNELKKGSLIKIDNELYTVVWFQHHKPGKGGAIVRTKLRNITKNTTVEKTFRSGENIEDIEVFNFDAQLLYKESNDFVFMNNENFEQYHVSEDVVGDSVKYLKNEMVCTLYLYENDIIIVEPPFFVELEITETDPGLKGDTVSGGTKPATLETGAVVQVPLFVSLGEKIKVDTRDDRYIERVK